MPRKGENIYKRKDGRWEGRYLDRTCQGPRKKYRSIYGRTYKEVRSKLKEQLQAIPEEPVYTMSYYTQKWLETNADSFKTSTYVKYKNLIYHHIFPNIGSYIVTDITTQVLLDLSKSLLSNGKRRQEGGLSTKTVKDILTLIHSILLFYQSLSPVPVSLPVIPYPKSEKRTIKILSSAEQKILENYLLSHSSLTAAGILLSLYTGIRLGELCALKWEYIDLEKGSITIAKTLQRIQMSKLTVDEIDHLESTILNLGDKTAIIITSPKTYKAKREIPLPDFIVPILEEFSCGIPSAFFLTGEPDIVPDPRTIQNRFKSILKKAQLPSVNYHAVRHSFASRCVEMDFELKALSEILGHAKTSTTLERYVHPSYDMKKRNINKLREFHL